MIKYLEKLSYINSVLGLNERNLDYVKKYNSKDAIKLADNKILTKKILNENGITTPKLISTIRDVEKLDNFKFVKLPGSMVVKPRRGFGGEGIIVFFSKDKNGNWLKADKTRYSAVDLRNHIGAILEGSYSLGGNKDTAFFEERVSVHPYFKKYSYKSVPDIRIVVFNKVPIMAMLRLGTSQSDGKANLHSGAVGVGIDIARGITTYGIQYDRLIDYHPDFDTPLRGLKIPYWQKILNLAVSVQKIINLGYIGIDIVIDRISGPLIMEVNARPGLGIQIANNDGLKLRLNRVKGLKIKKEKRGIQVGKNLFGGEVDEEIEELSGKQLVGFVENIHLNHNNRTLKIKTRNDSGALWSTIDEKIAVYLGYGALIEQVKIFAEQNEFKGIKQGRKIKQKAIEHFKNFDEISTFALVKQTTGLELRPIIKIEFEMSGVKQLGRFTISKRNHMLYRCIIGRKDLKRSFLVDPEKAFLS